MKPELLTTFSQFKVLPVIIGNTEHFMYIKSNNTNKSNDSKSDLTEFPNNRTLFIVNIPASSTENHFKRLFRRCGTIERIQFKSQPIQSGSSCHIVFQDEESILSCLSMTQRKRNWNLEGYETTQLGIEKWANQFTESRPDLEKIEKQVNVFMKQFEESEYITRKKTLEKKNIPDEDGFILVSRATGGKRGNRDGKGTVVKVANPYDVKPKKAKKLELVDFYRFQMRETKRKELAELRINFEKDRVKVEEFKETNRFKPY